MTQIITNKQQIKQFEQGFAMVRNADVQVVPVIVHKQGHNEGQGAKLIIADRFEHVFHPKHSVSLSLAAGTDALANRFKGGTFFFKENFPVEGQTDLVCFQDGSYKGFVHTDDGIQSLLDHIGATTQFNKAHYTNTTSKLLRLQNIRSNVEINIPQFQKGGDMTSQLSFAWDPFQSHIRAVFQVIRQICSNGMVGLADFMNSKVPMVNDWKRHMEIVDIQVQNKMTSIIGTRMLAMSKSHATIRDCYRIKNACMERLNDVKTHRNADQLDRLRRICMIADPDLHLVDKVPSAVLHDQRLCDLTSSHLSEFTAWNLLTELASHTYSTENSSQFALHKHANAILIDRDGSTNGAINNRLSQQLAFQNVDAAFARDMCNF